MASLPSNTFMFNYNAKQYNPSTYTFPKTSGQLFDEDLVLNKAPASYTEDSVYFGNTQAYTGRTGYTSNNNPFNRNASNTTLTFIYKTSGWTTNDGWTRIFANRYPSGTYNWWILGDRINSFILNCPNYNPQICVTRVNADGSAIRKFLDTNGNVVASASTASNDWYQGTSQGFGFFHGYANGGDFREYFNQTFYWMYCSLEALTDEEILKVIQYNEGSLQGISIDPDTINFDATGGTGTVDVSSENPWTASTTDNWISISPLTGSSDTTVTISAPYNSFGQRTGTVTFTDGEDSVDLTVTQKGNTLIPFKKMYKNGNRIN